MTGTQEIQLNVLDQENKRIAPQSKERSSNSSGSPAASNQNKSLKWWTQISIYTFLVLACQSAAILLGRLYYDKGGNSIWMATLVQLVGFPVFLPFYCCIPPTKQVSTNHQDERSNDKPSTTKLVGLYTCLGLILAADCMLYSIGLLYLPVSTYSIICASQLAFNAIFSFLLNKQEFTPYIINSLVLLTISSVILVLHSNDSSQNHGISRGKYIVGFICTVAASAGYGLLLPLTQFVFQKVLKSASLRAMLDVLVYQSLVASIAIVVGLFASGDWKTLKVEMNDYKIGKVSYLMTLIWTALNWVFFSIGSFKLIIEVSSLFSNVISTLGLPVVPILAVFLFHDTMDITKIVAMVLAIWGFVSYAYQCYLDDKKTSKYQIRNRE